ncbi:TM2 domain-containing protein [Corynebacterium mastitidis]|uniref:TM2 domain-containing protein n=1 Tax=Corynebacterium mastitidis TaxID=161890 RepID=A0A2N0X6Y7_9CORY|nr:TM2 domain-containing protein [Corynebacterium mastitidis]MCH6196190.1 TM2 domain-containing protein [Corynebacterium mastitidis]PKF68476.1 TM2 domain-containing protein [Corynebacterium mastitidis]
MASPNNSYQDSAGAWALDSQPQRSYIVAALLAFFLGEFGVHNFYIGYRTRAITQLVLYIVGWVLSFVLIGIPIVIAVHVWAFVDFVLILLRAGTYATDPYGRELS